MCEDFRERFGDIEGSNYTRHLERSDFRRDLQVFQEIFGGIGFQEILGGIGFQERFGGDRMSGEIWRDPISGEIRRRPSVRRVFEREMWPDRDRRLFANEHHGWVKKISRLERLSALLRESLVLTPRKLVPGGQHGGLLLRFLLEGGFGEKFVPGTFKVRCVERWCVFRFYGSERVLCCRAE